MTSLILSKKIIIPAIIFFGGLLIASGILILANFTAAQLSVASQSPQWTQQTGAGISVPACGSSSVSVSVTCSGGAPSVTFNNFISDHNPPSYLIIHPSGSNVSWVFTGYGSPLTSYIWGQAPSGGESSWEGPPQSNTEYWYQLFDSDGYEIFQQTFTTPNCAPAFDYSLSNSGNITVQQGNSGPNTITATLIAGATESISLSASGLPSGATASWPSGSSCSPNCLKGLTISTLVSTPAGTYPITVTGSPLGKTTTFNLTVTPALPGDFTLNPPSAACNSVSLSWTAASGADGYRILRGSPRVDISPYQPYTALNFTDTTVSQNTVYLYQIEAYNSGGTNRSNTINVTTPFCPPTLNFFGSPTSIFQGQSSTLTWSSANVTSCTASGKWSGSKPVNGNEVVIPSPPPSATYNLTCSGPGGSVNQSATINITPLALPDWREIIPR